MSADLSVNFNEQYMNINTKLKKRFMRKPNILEATNEFIALAIQCEHSEQPEFAGHAYIGAAKCEATAGNFLGEAEQFLAAARQFMKAEKKLMALKFYSPDREHLEAAIGCYMQALTKYPEKCTLRTSILLELADHLVSLNHKMEALSYYEQALSSIEDKTRRMMAMRTLLNLQLECGKYDMALETANTMSDAGFDMPEDILNEVQISRILLTLLVQPVEKDQPSSLRKLFSDLLANDDIEYGLPFSTELYLSLQSIVLSAAGEASALASAGANLRAQLPPVLHNLLDTLLDEKRREYLMLV